MPSLLACEPGPDLDNGSTVLNSVPREFREALRWLPHPPYHNHAARRTVEVLVRLGRPFEFQGDDRVKAWWVDHGEAGCKVYEPVNRTSDAVMLWIHGGGYILLEAYLDDEECRRMADELGITVVSAEYRHAPKHPFPAALDDCRQSWHWLQEHAEELGIDPRRSVIAGESAGGGLTAALAQRLHDEGGIQPLAQLLFCPMLDDHTALRDDLSREQYYIWNNQNNMGGWTSYLGQAPGAAEVPPYAVPARRESLAGLPPAWVGVGTADLFLEESEEYAERLVASGVDCELFIAEGGVHSFHTILPDAEISVAFWNSMMAFTQRILAQG
jgi:acetyl esterase/lipase